MSERMKFEAWLRSIWTAGYDCRRGPGGESYVSGEAQNYWTAWQAAIAAQEPKQAMADAEIERISEDHIGAYGIKPIEFARAIESASSPNKELVEALQQVEQALIKLEHAVGGGDGEIYVEGAILTCQAALRAAGVEAV